MPFVTKMSKLLEDDKVDLLTEIETFEEKNGLKR